MASDPITRTTSSCLKSESHAVAACYHLAVVSDLKSRLRVAKPIAQDLDQEDGFAWCDLRSESFTEAPDGLQFGWHPSMLQSVQVRWLHPYIQHQQQQQQQAASSQSQSNGLSHCPPVYKDLLKSLHIAAPLRVVFIGSFQEVFVNVGSL